MSFRESIAALRKSSLGYAFTSFVYADPERHPHYAKAAARCRAEGRLQMDPAEAEILLAAAEAKQEETLKLFEDLERRRVKLIEIALATVAGFYLLARGSTASAEILGTLGTAWALIAIALAIASGMGRRMRARLPADFFVAKFNAAYRRRTSSIDVGRSRPTSAPVEAQARALAACHLVLATVGLDEACRVRNRHLGLASWSLLLCVLAYGASLAGFGPTLAPLFQGVGALSGY